MSKKLLIIWIGAVTIWLFFSTGFANDQIALLRSKYTFDLYHERGWGDYDSLHVIPAKLLLSELPYQYDFVSDHFIEQDSLRRMGYALLIIPDATAMSITEYFAIEDFVRDGGVAFITGTSGIHDGINWLNAFWLSPAMGVQWPGFQREISESSFWNIDKILSGDPQHDAIFKGVFEKNRVSSQDTTDITENDIVIKNGWEDGAVVPIFPTTGEFLAYWTDYNLDSLQLDPRGYEDKAWALTCNKFGNGYVVYFNGKLFSGYKYCREIASWAHRDTDPCQNAEKLVFNVIRNFTNIPKTNLELTAWWMERQHHERSKLVDSYEDGDRQFGHNAAFLYDQALSVLVYCALAKSAQDSVNVYREKAGRILRTLTFLQNVDGSFPFSWQHKDERLEATNEARFSGANAWVLMAINRYEEQSADSITYRGIALNLANWLFRQLELPDGNTLAIRGGINAKGEQLSFKSVEHNLDAYSAFGYFGYLTGDLRFTKAAQGIRRWLENITWNNAAGHFLRGENDTVATMDVNPWGILALGTIGWLGFDFTRGLDWAIENCRNTHAWEGNWDPYPNLIGTVTGFDFNDDKDVVWVEGTESMALALQLADWDSLADYFHAEMAKLITAANDGGLPYATNEGTIASDDPSLSTTYPSVAGTAWYIFKELNYNPFEIPQEAHPHPDSVYDVINNAEDLTGLSISGFHLFQNYPNPFNPKTIINYQLPVVSEVKLYIYNIIGENVAKLIAERQEAGHYEMEWDASGLSSGLYFCRLMTSSGFVQTKKLLLLK